MYSRILLAFLSRHCKVQYKSWPRYESDMYLLMSHLFLAAQKRYFP